MHDFYLTAMRNAPNRLEPDYARRLIGLEVDASSGNAATHPVTVRLERLDPEHSGQIETVKARYVVGCDGARSVVRQSLGHALKGDSANQAWGVMDVLAVTDFPDIRFKALIQSANEGNIVLIPREGGYLVRIYVELDKLNENERVANRNITVDHLIATTQRILHPYHVRSERSRVVVGLRHRPAALRQVRRRTRRSDRAPRAARVHRRRRLSHAQPESGAGHECLDAGCFNLGWKLAAVLRGQCAPEFLHTYSAERQAVAKELIEFDREWAKLISAPLKSSSG